MEKSRPTIICCKTVIGYGSPKFQGTSQAHGAPLGMEEAEVVRKKLNWKHKPFIIPKDIYDKWNAHTKGEKYEKAWKSKLSKYKKLYKKESLDLERRIKSNVPKTVITKLNNFMS